MSNVLFFTGSILNAFARGVVTVSPTEETTATKERLYDGKPGSPVIFGSKAADGYMRVDQQALAEPGFEASLASWVDGDVGTGTSAVTTTAGEFQTGAAALELTGSDGSNYGSRYQDITVKAGEWRKATTYCKAISAGVGGLYIRNLKTGNYLQSDLTWAATRNPVATSNVTDWTAVTATYQVESFETCRADTVTLRWELACESGNVCFDDCLDVPGITWASIHGHNLGGTVVPTVQSSDDASAWTTRATMTIKRGAFFSTFSIIYAQHWQIKLVGTPVHAAPHIGEAVLAQYQTAPVPVTLGPMRSRNFPGVRSRGTTGQAHTVNMTEDPTESVSLMFTAHSAADARGIADDLWLRSGQGKHPVVVAPIDTEDKVYFGQILEPLGEPRPLKDRWEFSMDLVGAPFPTVGA